MTVVGPIMTSDERLALIRLKIERADKHIKDLEAGIRNFIDSNPYKVATRRNPQTRQLIYYVASAAPVPNCLAIIAGNILNNLRSSLDHLTQQLYLVGAGGAKGYRGLTSFLIAETAKEFKAGLPRKVEGRRQDAIDAIRALEPYNGGQGADLWAFHRLNNVDKHRLIVAVGSNFAGVTPALPSPFAERFAEIFPGGIAFPDLFITPADNLFPLEAGDELFIDAVDAEPNEKMKFAFQIVIHEPGIVEGKPLLETLVQFSNRVSGIVNSFRPWCLNGMRARQPKSTQASSNKRSFRDPKPAPLRIGRQHRGHDRTPRKGQGPPHLAGSIVLWLRTSCALLKGPQPIELTPRGSCE